MEDHATGLRFYQGNIYSKVFTNPRTEISSICLFNVSTAEVSQFSRGPWSSHPYTAGDPYYIAGHLSYLVSEKLTQVSENPCLPDKHLHPASSYRCWSSHPYTAYKLNFLASDKLTLNCISIMPSPSLVLSGSVDGRVEAWDLRQRKWVGVLDCVRV